MNNLQYKFSRSYDLLVAIIITTALTITVIKFNIFATIDGDIHLNWSYFWNQQILEGQFYPRWFEAAFDGLGTTSFIFYPPLMRALSLPFGLIRLPPTMQLKGAIALTLFINSYGVIKLSHLLFKSNYLYNLIAIVLGIFNPFFLSELFKRGGFPSLCFLSLIPWLMMGIIYYLKKPSILNLVYLSLIYAAIFLSHIPSCLIFVSAYSTALLILFFLVDNKFKQIIIQLTIALFLGALIDAFFVAPILFDTHLVYQAFVPNTNVIHNRLFLNGLFKLQPSLIPKGIEDVIIKIFLLNTGLFLFTIFTAYPWKAKDNRSFLFKLQIFIVAFSLLMSTEIAYPIYARIDSFRKLQFPWRYLSLTSTLIPYLATYAFSQIAGKFAFFRVKIVTISIVLIILLFNYKSAGFILRTAGAESNFINKVMISDRVTTNEPLPPKINLEKLGARYKHLALPKKGAPIFFVKKDRDFVPADVTDYVPKTAAIEKEWLNLKRPNSDKKIQLPPSYSNIEFIEGQGDFEIKQWNQGKRIFKVQITENAILNLKTLYYPGWKLKLTSLKQNHEFPQTLVPAQDGRIQLKLAPGVYDVEIYYRGTVAERVGVIVTILTILALFITLVLQNYPSKILSN